MASSATPSVEPQPSTSNAASGFQTRYISSGPSHSASESNLAARFSIIASRRRGSSVMWPISSCSSEVIQ